MSNQYVQPIWVPFIASGGNMPGMVCVEHFDSHQTDDGELELDCRQPTRFGAQYSHYVTWPRNTPEGGRGWCTRFGHMICRVEAGAAIGDMVGPRNEEFFLQLNTGGFQVVGMLPEKYEDVAVGANIAIVQAAPWTRFTGIGDGASLEGSGDNTVKVQYGTNGDYFDAGHSFEDVQNSFGDYDSGAELEVIWEGDKEGLKWKIIQANCPSA